MVKNNRKKKHTHWRVWIVVLETPYGYSPCGDTFYRTKEAAQASITNPLFIGKPIQIAIEDYDQ